MARRKLDTHQQVALRISRALKRTYRLMAELNALDTTTFGQIQVHINGGYVALLEQALADYDVSVVLLHDGKRE